MAEKQEGGNGSLSGETPVERADSGNRFLSSEASEALERLRTVVDQAAHTLRELGEASRQWTDATRDRARGWRGQGERAVETVSHQVEQNPMASLAVALAVGFVAGALLRR